MTRLVRVLAFLVVLLAAITGCGARAAVSGGSQSPAAGRPPPSSPAPVSFGALGGYGCPQLADARFYESGWYTDGINGFFGVRTGGWRKQGCDGRFGAMPMSGNATKPDAANYALWVFRTAPVVTGTCQVAVYVPDDHSIEHVGGDPARYQVFDNATASGGPAGSFTLNELTRLGSWASSGSYPVTNGVLTIKLTSAGQDWHGNVETHAHLPLSQVIVFCGKPVPGHRQLPSGH